MASLRRQLTDSEKQQVLALQRRNDVLYCFVDDHPIESEEEVEFHHIKPFSEDGPTEVANIGAVCKDHHRRIRTLSLSEFRDQLAMDRFFDHPDQRRLDDLLGFKLTANGFGRPVTSDGDQQSQVTLHFTNPDRPPQTCPVFSCPATGMRYFYSVLPIEYICNDSELQPRPLEKNVFGNCTDTSRDIHSLRLQFVGSLQGRYCYSMASINLLHRFGLAERRLIARCTSILMFGC